MHHLLTTSGHRGGCPRLPSCSCLNAARLHNSEFLPQRYSPKLHSIFHSFNARILCPLHNLILSVFILITPNILYHWISKTIVSPYTKQRVVLIVWWVPTFFHHSSLLVFILYNFHYSSYPLPLIAKPYGSGWMTCTFWSSFSPT